MNPILLIMAVVFALAALISYENRNPKYEMVLWGAAALCLVKGLIG